ncbi:MAG: MFS transporter [Bacteroidaceae bacterium]|nr:MFS transporter [Bacteroidaceae bacterium]MBQ9170461.1 MFS transporter [Bacteroidaceae bacterium]MBQ9293610.1 MFS transporter [Bacteroidaceae bacterium]
MNPEQKKTNYRWVICGMLFLATTINYMDRQVLSLTWKDFIAPEFHWTDADYGRIAAIFSIVYAIGNLFSGRFMDWIGTKKGYLWAIGIWSLGACMHAFCGTATAAWLGLEGKEDLINAVGTSTAVIASVSTWFFIICRIVLGLGESGNFPCAIKVTAEYFPKKDRAFPTAIFNSGSTIGALIAPVCIPLIAKYYGWEMAFIIIGALGFVWLGLWVFVYKKPEESKHVNEAELAYIQQDSLTPQPLPRGGGEEGSRTLSEESLPPRGEVGGGLPFLKFLTFPQTWGIFLAKFITDGVWWFFLFWTPAYISDVYGLKSDNPTAMLLIFVLYAITMLSIYGGKLPTIIVNKTGLHPYDARLKAMFIFTLFPLLTLFAQPLGAYSYWFPIVLIGLAGAAHQSWSANLFSVGSDLFPKNAVGTMTGINGMAGGISSFLINWISGYLFDYADQTQMHFLGFTGKPAGYFIIFIYCAVAYLLGWLVLKAFVPKYKAVSNE